MGTSMRPEIPLELAMFPTHCVHQADLTIAGLHIKYFKLGQSPEDQSNGPDQVRVNSKLIANSHRI